ncbi:MAG TPA: PAS domain S-box protein [Crinalium sp.]
MWMVQTAIALSILIGTLVLLGWQFDIELLKQGLPGNLVTMKANAALCFVVVGVTLKLLQVNATPRRHPLKQYLRYAIYGLSLFVLLVGLLTLSEHVFSWNLGIDQLLFQDVATPYNPHPGRMGDITALNFLLVGIAFLLLLRNTVWADWVAQLLSCLTAFVGLLPLVGYLFGVEIFASLVLNITTTAPHSAIAFLIIDLGILYLRPHRGLMRTVTSPLPGGEMARSLLPWAIALPLLLNWFTVYGERQRWYSPEFGDAGQTTIIMMLFVSVVWWTARSLNHTEHRRQQMERGLRELDRQFQRAIVNAPIPIMLHTQDGNVWQISQAWTDLTGYAPDELPTIDAWTEKAYGDRKTAVREGIHKLYSLTHSVAENEFEICTRQGTNRIWDFFSAPIGRLDDGRRMIMSAAIDVTERRQAELALQRLNVELEQRVAERTAELLQANARLQQELTERQQLERRLEEGKQLLSDFFNAASIANIGLCIHDQDLRYLKVNQALAKINGHAIDAHLGKTVDDLLPELSSTVTPLLQQVLDTRQPITGLELSGAIANQSGQMHDWQVFYFPIFNPLNEAIAVGVMVIDITERKQAEQAIHISEARYRAIVEDQTELICRYLPDGTILFINGAYCRYFGLQQDEMIGKSYAPVVFTDDQDIVADLVQSMTPDNPTVLIENRVVVGDQVRWTQWINRMLFDEEGQFAEYQSVGRDITDLKQVEATLQQQQALLSGIISGSKDLIAALDLNFCFTTFNQPYHDEFFKIFGYDIQLGMSLVDALAHLPEEQARVVDIWRQALAGREFTIVQDFGDATRQRNCYEVTFSLIRNEQGLQIGAAMIARDVSDRRRTEQLLRDSEERYRSVVTAMTEGIVLQQADGRITAWNDSAERILGLTADQLVGKTSTDLDWRTIYEDGSPFPGSLHPTMITLQTGQPQSEVIMGICKADETTWISINSQPLFHPNQSLPYAAVSSFADITVHKQAEEKLRASEARFRSAFDDAAIGMALVALDGKFLQVNRALCKIIGYSPEELLQLDFQTITHPDDLELDLSYADQLLKGEIQTYQMEKRYIHKSQRTVWILLHGSIVRDSMGQPLHFIAQIKDISDRKRAEQELELQAVITRNIAEGICLIRVSDGIIVYSNSRFDQMFGYAPGELNGQPVSLVNYAEDQAQAQVTAQAIIDQVLEFGEATYEVHNVRQDGTPFWCRATTSMFAHPEYGNVLVAVQQDITERKQTEEKVRASLREKEVLLQEIHHRVKNNLQIVDGLLKMQSRRTKDPQVSSVLRDSQSRIASIALVHEKLYRSDDLANIDFAQYIRDLTIHLFESYNIDFTQITLQIQADGIFLDIETGIPCGLIINELVSNALKYAFPDDRKGKIQIALTLTGDRTLTLTVRDNGVGLPPDFDLTSMRSLGMILIQGLVDQLEGKLTLQNTPGAEFIITFQIAKH